MPMSLISHRTRCAPNYYEDYPYPEWKPFRHTTYQGNTVAILTVGDISKRIGDRYGVDNKKCASILDTFSCTIQGLIPYGAQMLIAAGLASLNPVSILPYLYYPFVLGIVALLSIILRYPRRYS